MQLINLKLKLFSPLLSLSFFIIACGESKGSKAGLPAGNGNIEAVEPEKIVEKGKIPDSKKDDPIDPIDDGSAIEEDGEIDIEIKFGIKNYQQINDSMSVLTGVDKNNSAIVRTYEDVKAQLPNDNDLGAFLGSHQVAISKLALEYCDQAFENAELRQNIIPDFDFSLPVQSALDQNGRKVAAAGIAAAFLEASFSNDEEIVEAKVEIEELIAELIVGKANNSTITRNVLKGVCNAVLASSPIVMF
ncbi:MAG: hypothetical protein KBD78_07190 [Oligoflexales bacterium]|nr:hypothetical protein [Oligoflexales bacterium]